MTDDRIQLAATVRLAKQTPLYERDDFADGDAAEAVREWQRADVPRRKWPVVGCVLVAAAFAAGVMAVAAVAR